MPVQIPTLKRFAPQDPASVGRIETQVPNAAKPFAQTSDALEKVVAQGADYIQKEEDYAIDTKSQEIAQTYEKKYKTALAQAENFKGDPTELYAKIDEDAKKWKEELSTLPEGASSRLKDAIAAKITRVNDRLYDVRSTRQAHQYAKYEAGVAETGIKLHQESMLTAIETLDAKDPLSLIPLQKEIDGIIKLRHEYGDKIGLMSKDAEGNKTPSESLRFQARKDVSEGLEKAILTLNASGKTDEAKLLMDQYGSEMLSDHKLKVLNADFKKSVDKKVALGVADKYRTLDPDDAITKIDNDEKLTPEQRELAMKYIDTNTRIKQLNLERSQKRAYEAVSEMVTTLQNSEQPILTKDQLYLNEAIAPFMGRLRDKDRRAIEERIEKPKNTDSKAWESAYEKMLNGDFAKMSPHEFNQAMVGISAKDRSMFERRYTSDRTDTGQERREMVTFMGQHLKGEMLRFGLTKNKTHKKSDEIKYRELYTAMVEQAEKFPQGTNRAEQAKAVTDAVVRFKKDKVFNLEAPGRQKFESRPSTSPTPAPEGEKKEAPKTELSVDERREWAKRYYLKTKQIYKPADDPDGSKIRAFIKAEGGKL